jgi:hypothetical protein
MASITPMFPGWHRKLYGRKPVRPGIEMPRKAVEISSLCLRQAKDLFGDLLATELLESKRSTEPHYPALAEGD